MKEIWKDIPGYEGMYQASSVGRFRSLDREYKHNTPKGRQIRKGKILKQQHEGNGYLQVAIQIPKSKFTSYQKRLSAHRLIAKTFVPNPLNKPFVNHKDGVKDNNKYMNLEWCTRSENAKHSFKIGLQSNVGIKHPCHILIEEQVMEIRKKYIPKIYTSYRLAEEYGVSRVTINDLINRKTWSHIK